MPKSQALVDVCTAIFVLSVPRRLRRKRPAQKVFVGAVLHNAPALCIHPVRLVYVLARHEAGPFQIAVLVVRALDEALESAESRAFRLAHDVTRPQRRQDAILFAKLRAIHGPDHMRGWAKYLHEKIQQRIGTDAAIGIFSICMIHRTPLLGVARHPPIEIIIITTPLVTLLAHHVLQLKTHHRDETHLSERPFFKFSFIARRNTSQNLVRDCVEVSCIRRLPLFFVGWHRHVRGT